MKWKMNSAAQRRETFNLKGQHITTTDFAQVSPVYKRLLCPGDKFNIRMSLLCNVAAMQFPTYGNIQIVNRAFFVPLRSVWSFFKEFKEESKVEIDGSFGVPKVPYIKSDDIFALFKEQGHDIVPLSTRYETVPSGGYDFVEKVSENTYYYKLTRVGRYWFKVFRSLGYPVTNISAIADEFAGYRMNLSALPLLCWFKIYVDSLCPSQFSQDNPLKGLLNTIVGSLNYHVTEDDLIALVNAFRVPYPDDLYMLAWEYPQSVRDNYVDNAIGAYGNADTSKFDTSRLGTYYSTDLADVDKNTVAASYDTSTAPFIRLLLSVQNYVNRNNLSGGRFIENLLSRYGVKVPRERLDMAEYIGEYRVPLTIAKVTNVAETDGGSPLGSYAGQAMGWNNEKGSFEYEAVEDGYIFVAQYLDIDTTTVEGVDRDLFNFTPVSFFTPEFDGLGLEAIGTCEVAFPSLNTYEETEGASPESISGALQTVNLSSPDSVFGFAPMYYDYKFGKSRLTGDFLVNTLNKGADSMHLFRMTGLQQCLNLQDSSDDYTDYMPVISAQDSSFIFSEQRQFDRIFAVTSDEVDHFYITNNFDVIAERPMKKLGFSLPMENSGHEIVASPIGTGMQE